MATLSRWFVTALLLAACHSSAAQLAGEAGAHCGHDSPCAASALCVCPGGARSCNGNATCAELCQANSDGSHTCPSGGSCALESAACCEGIPSCTLTCLHDYVCAP